MTRKTKFTTRMPLLGLSLFFGILVLVISPTQADQIDCGNYRIALSFDGNAHDPDDIIAAPMALAMIAEAGLTDKFVFSDFSNHIWNDDGSQPAEMRESIDGVCERWGIDRSKLFEARVSTELNKAKTAFRNAAIEAYNAGATLYYACGGPMEVPYQMVSNLEAKYRAVVTVVSHHWWNDEHGTVDKNYHAGAHGWNDLKAIAGNSLYIRNQNEPVWSSSVSGWSWLRDKGGKYQWLHDRNPFGTKKFDCSDAGMTYYLITGRGNEDATMDDVKWVFNQSHSCGGGGGTTNNPPSVSFSTPTNGTTFGAPADVAVTVNATDSDGSIVSVELRNNGTLVGTDTQSPYTWNLTGLSAGTYTLEATAYDNEAASTVTSIAFSVIDGSGTGNTVVLEAENYSSMLGVATEPCSEGGLNVTDINVGDYLTFNSVNFGTGASQFSVRVAGIRDRGGIELRLDGPDGPVIGYTDVPITGDWQAWTTLTGTLTGATGVHTLYVMFTGTITKFLFNLNWISFSTDGGTTTNTPPSVAITSPADGASFTAPATVTVDVDASDSDGSISKVELRRNGSLVGTENASPYTFSLSSLSAGTYSLEARAYDNDGATTNASITISVSDTTVSDTTVTDTGNGGSLVLEAEDYSSMLGITTEPCSEGGLNVTDINVGDYLAFDNIDFGTGAAEFSVRVAGIRDRGGIELRLDSPSGTVIGYTDVPITGDWQTWTTLTSALTGASGVHTLYVVFTGTITKYLFNLNWVSIDGAGGGTTPPPNSAPSVSITSPSDGAAFTAPASVTVDVTASDADGSISKVELRNNGVLVATETASPYSFSLTGLSAGTYTLEARAYDNENATTNASISISVTDSGTTNTPPTVAITAPSDGASFAGPIDVAVTADASDTDGSITKVELHNNGVLVGEEALSPYTWSLVGLTAGTYTLVATAYDNEGATSVSSIAFTVTEDGGSTGTMVTLEAENYSSMSGIATEPCTEGGLNVTDINDGDYLVFNNVDFGTGGSIFDVRVASPRDKGTIELRLDGVTGPLVGSIHVPITGDWQIWETLTGALSGASGVHNLYVVFTGTNTKFLFNLNWIAISTGSLSKQVPAMVLPARSPVDLANVNIYDMTGRLVFVGTVRDGSSISAETLGFREKGAFVMKVRSKHGSMIRKLVIK